MPVAAYPCCLRALPLRLTLLALTYPCPPFFCVAAPPPPSLYAGLPSLLCSRAVYISATSSCPSATALRLLLLPVPTRYPPLSCFPSYSSSSCLNNALLDHACARHPFLFSGVINSCAHYQKSGVWRPRAGSRRGAEGRQRRRPHRPPHCPRRSGGSCKNKRGPNATAHVGVEAEGVWVGGKCGAEACRG